MIIITQTAYTDSNERKKSFEVGTNEFITKPINSKELENLILKHFDNEE